MSLLIGNPQLITAPSAALGSASGRTIALNNPGWVLPISAVLTYVATATAGTRNPVLRFLDSSGNIVWHVVCAGASIITAGLTTRLLFGSILQSTTVSAVAAQQLETLWRPAGMSLPPSSSLVILDGSAIDNTDTVQLNSLIWSN